MKEKKKNKNKYYPCSNKEIYEYLEKYLQDVNGGWTASAYDTDYFKSKIQEYTSLPLTATEASKTSSTTWTESSSTATGASGSSGNNHHYYPKIDINTFNNLDYTTGVWDTDTSYDCTTPRVNLKLTLKESLKDRIPWAIGPELTIVKVLSKKDGSETEIKEVLPSDTVVPYYYADPFDKSNTFPSFFPKHLNRKEYPLAVCLGGEENKEMHKKGIRMSVFERKNSVKEIVYDKEKKEIKMTYFES